MVRPVCPVPPAHLELLVPQVQPEPPVPLVPLVQPEPQEPRVRVPLVPLDP